MTENKIIIKLISCSYYYGFLTQDSVYNIFQLYSITAELLVIKILELLIFKQAVIFLLAILIISIGLYCKNYLNLSFSEVDNIKSTDKIFLIWNSIFLLVVILGLTIFTTIFKANREFIKLFNIYTVFNYRSFTVIEDISYIFRDLNFVGIYNIIIKKLSFTAISEIFNMLNSKIFIISILPCN
ncbi:hypothetical protein ASPFODRAFT_65853 [Aspergillus luchuensis CBS 106.47]|uniref:Uncharacterized protein n=1 Tax=Aspergillus luchuensis (strain CBS 106.47) TaxID=1137211 RepID=A0A1M3T1G4_ASPLC|nr:hypothetical protein ASPFODRAFT_65853 [Aspergillus luchuensis CBS 106.47]